MASHTFVVEEIHCGACETAIRKALTRVEGVQEVAADSTSNEVSVRFDDARTSDREIVERLATAGYPVLT